MPQNIATHLPFPTRISQDVDRAEAGILRWPRSFGLFAGADAERRHMQGGFPELAGRFHPSATGCELDLGVDQQSWFFLFDDRFDGPVGQDPVRAKELTDTVIDVLSAPSRRRPAEPFAAAFADLWERSRAGMAESWCSRAAGNWRSYLAGHVTEAANRDHHARPSAADHLALRRDTCGVPPILDLAERLGHFEVPERAYRCPLVTELRLIAAEVVGLDNEMFSLEKEEAIGDNNLVLILAQEAHCSRAEAIDRICDLIRERTGRFVALERRLPRLCDELGLDEAERSALRRYQLDAVRTIMRGAHDWQRNCARYTSSYLGV
jgi:pentalenene synthase